jgi:hypothetical protein
LGSSWQELAEPIRRVHASGTVRARGRLRITNGRGYAAGFCARVLRLPRASEAAETRLVVTPDASGERWRRTFGDRCLDTRQYQAGDGELAERFGLLEFRFRLEASEGSLVFHQLEAALLCGPMRLRLPAACAPTVDAREDPSGADRISVHVTVALTAFGPVLTYDGTVEIEESRA